MISQLDSPFIKKVQFKTESIPSFDEYPFHLPFIQSAGIEFHPRVTYIIGENGMGKSTLLEAIAVASGFNPEGGTFNFNFSTHDSHSELGNYIKLIKGIKRPKDGFFLRAETFYNVATNIEELDSEPGGGRIIDSFGGNRFIGNHMVNLFLRYLIIASEEMAFIFWMSLRQLFHH